MKRPSKGFALVLPLDPNAPQPLHRQVYDGLRSAILCGRLAAGTRLPATRILAQELGLSRSTILNAFDQLLAEGYLEGRTGDGTYVARCLPDDALFVSNMPDRPQASVIAPRTLSQRGQLLAGLPICGPHDGGQPRPFRLCLPALDQFPFEIWSRLAHRWYTHTPIDLMFYGQAAGYAPLREAIVEYLGAARGVHCAAEQVIVVAGAQQALDLAARVLLDPEDNVWVEDPGYLGAWGVLRGAGAKLVPVPVDHEGLDVAAGTQRCPSARLAYVTPSHQYQLGVTMSLSRRLALLNWASRTGSWILEDDYDSEYRYTGRPLAALQGLDTEGRVIYVGTFSKVMFPGLRLGYLVVPPDLVDAFVSARRLVDRHSPMIEQAMLTDFITEGHFVRHIRRMRALYAERQAMLIECMQQELGGLITIPPSAAGMHLVGWLAPGLRDTTAAAWANQHGIDVPPLSAYRCENQPAQAVLLGYTSLSRAEMLGAVQQLARAWSNLRPMFAA